ncbi:MAG: hypothetical protein ACXVCS_14335 [Bdellovibrionota bacterium]
MLRFPLFTLAVLALCGCGVKLPPIAPQSRPLATTNVKPNTDCSPTQENCDKTDPNYRPQGR